MAQQPQASDVAEAMARWLVGTIADITQIHSRTTMLASDTISLFSLGQPCQ
jgi:hypothetical protein